jgi:hypothetical protein
MNAQLCESFHARMAKLSCKDIAWRQAWRARVVAVLDMNESGRKLQLYESLGLPKLHPSAVQIIHWYEYDIAHRARKRSKQDEASESTSYSASLHTTTGAQKSGI